uniref:Phosphodiesterase n=1 Tax=Strigamia maritima TaxID=126957 RepID=T1IN43_STRMM
MATSPRRTASMTRDLHKSSSLPAIRPGETRGARQRTTTMTTAKQKCILKLDGYSYVIVASPPEKKCSKDDSELGTTRRSKSASRNGQLSKQSGLTIVRSSALRKTALTRSSKVQNSIDDAQLDQLDLTSDNLPSVDSPDACDKASVRLRSILRQLQGGKVPIEVLQKNLQFAIQVLDAVYTDETRDATSDEDLALLSSATPVPLPIFKPRKLVPPCSKRWNPKQARRLTEDEDDLSEVQPDAVPPEVREWLASTFTRQLSGQRRKTDEKPSFRSVAHVIRAGIFVERIYRRMSSSASLQFPPQVMALLKNIDDWSFDVFAVNDASNNQPVRYIGYDLLNRYGIINKFKISPTILENFLGALESGYCKYKNPYHNNIHAADVTQTVHFMLCQTGLMHWLTDLEIFATLIAAVTHDFEHTGTTNNFHVNSGSDIALLYNDRAVLENHHISATFRLLKADETNIVSNLSREEFREFRTLVIDMVLATDMSSHFQQLKIMKNMLTLPEFSVDKSKALALVLHCCDISHPSKRWDLHYRWTEILLEEFFQQGDKEKELGLSYSPLCDRSNTHVAESQIGFIDFIVDPSMQVCSDMLERVMATMQPPRNVDEAIREETFGAAADVPALAKTQSLVSKQRSTASMSSQDSVTSTKSDGSLPGSPKGVPLVKSKSELKKPWLDCLVENKKIWAERAAKGIDGLFSRPGADLVVRRVNTAMAASKDKESLD